MLTNVCAFACKVYQAWNRGDLYVYLFSPPPLGLYHSKRYKTPCKDDAMLCLPLSIDRLREETPDRVGREMARCLHEVYTS